MANTSGRVYRLRVILLRTGRHVNKVHLDLRMLPAGRVPRMIELGVEHIINRCHLLILDKLIIILICVGLRDISLDILNNAQALLIQVD